MTYDPRFDEELLAHYDEQGRAADYLATLNRMRRNGHEPSGPGAPLPGSQHYHRSTGGEPQ